MEHRFLGASGFKVPALGFGAGTFGGKGPLFSAWGDTDVAGAAPGRHLSRRGRQSVRHGRRVFRRCFRVILGAALEGPPRQRLISTKVTLRAATGPNDVGASRHHLVRAVEPH